MKNQRINWILYLILGVLSIGTISASLLFKDCAEWFTIISGIGCGAFASVVIACLLELSNINSQVRISKRIMNHVLSDFDLCVKTEMLRALSACIKNKDFEFDKEYSVMEIHSFLEKLENSNPIFVSLCQGFNSTIDKISSLSILNFEKTDTGIRLFEDFEIIRTYANISDTLINNGCEPEFIKFLIMQIIETINNIETIRGTHNHYKLPKTANNL